MAKRIIEPEPWMARAGFVPACEVSGTVRTLYVAGVTSVDANGAPLHEGDMHGQLVQAIDTLEAVLKSAGYSLSDIVRLTTYTTDMDAFRQVRPALQQRLDDAKCQYAASLIGVARLARPQDLLELEATAVS
jgi:enamine deaminase RidA (YjgF/YER057c/UK114 family)